MLENGPVKTRNDVGKDRRREGEKVKQLKAIPQRCLKRQGNVPFECHYHHELVLQIDPEPNYHAPRCHAPSCDQT